MSCGSKLISKRNGGNTFAKITITPFVNGLNGNPLIWNLSNEMD